MAFWSACHGGQRDTAEYLLERGADINWIGWDEKTPLDVVDEASQPSWPPGFELEAGSSQLELRE